MDLLLRSAYWNEAACQFLSLFDDRNAKNLSYFSCPGPLWDLPFWKFIHKTNCHTPEPPALLSFHFLRVGRAPSGCKIKGISWGHQGHYQKTTQKWSKTSENHLKITLIKSCSKTLDLVRVYRDCVVKGRRKISRGGGAFRQVSSGC